ncbi:hypothetical protein [Psychromonas sp. psych-6C06]|nr:hypothetical protein [Psychromonas sp. psych-6C06]
MKSKKKMLRNKNIWYCVWNSKNANQSPKCDAAYLPTRHSEK